MDVAVFEAGSQHVDRVALLYVCVWNSRGDTAGKWGQRLSARKETIEIKKKKSGSQWTLIVFSGKGKYNFVNEQQKSRLVTLKVRFNKEKNFHFRL